MKIVVSHVSKQYANHLLIALERAGWLHLYYTGFAGNRWLRIFGWSNVLVNQLRKRVYTGIPFHRIRTLSVAFLLEQFGKNAYWTIRYSSRLFDHWVAHQLSNEPFDLLIAYENANLRTFRTAKKLGRITVLDLAQVHHNMIALLNARYKLDTLTLEQTLYVDQRKELALMHTDYILTLSSFATDSLVENGFPRDRIYQAPLGIQPDLFTPKAKPTDGTLHLLFVGATMYRKGITILLDAFAQLAEYDIALTVIGPASDAQPEVDKFKDRITYFPYLHHDELRKHYQQAHLFVFPSLLDSWAQVVLEAMACGTPVIITANTGAKDAVQHGGGFVVPTGDALALVEKILYFYQNREAVNHMGREARQVAEQYTWEHYYQEVTHALMEIAQREGILSTPST